jgi:hypothetical protein
MHYIPYVYNVERIKVLGTSPVLESETDIPLFMYYWEPDTHPVWASKLASAELEITYTGARDGEDKTRKLTVAEASSLARNIVWETPNPFNTASGDDYSPYQPFGVSGVIPTAIQAQTDKKIKNVAWDKLPGQYINDDGVDVYPAIRVNYRGAIAEVPVDIVNSVTGFQVNYKGASTINPLNGGFMDMRWERRRLDNDLGPGGMPKWDQMLFGAEFDAEVTLESVRGNTTKWTDLGPIAVTTDADSKLGAPAVGPASTITTGNAKKFTTNFGLVSKTGVVAGSWDNKEPGQPPNSLNWEFQEATWGIAGYKKNGTRDGTNKTITFYYMPPTLDTSRPATTTGKINAKIQKQTQSATFKDIGVWVEYRE